MSFTVTPATSKVLAVPPVEMISIPAFARICANGIKPVLSETEMSARWIFAMTRRNLPEFQPVRNSNRQERGRLARVTKSETCGRTARAPFLFRRHDHFLADGALEVCAGGVVIMQRLDLRRARLRECGLGVQHVELRAGAGIGARPGLAQRLIGLFLDFFLRVQNFLRLDETGISRAHLKFNLARLVGQVIL